jgi:hypothetical protein
MQAEYNAETSELKAVFPYPELVNLLIYCVALSGQIPAHLRVVDCALEPMPHGETCVCLGLKLKLEQEIVH